MYTILPQWKTVEAFAEVYVKTKGENAGKPGVGRSYIYELIEKEKAAAAANQSPGPTNIDVMEIDGKVFVKYRNAPTSSQIADAKRRVNRKA